MNEKFKKIIMKKVKLFCVGVIFLITTISVFAARSKFLTTPLYVSASSSGIYYELTQSATWNAAVLTTTITGTQIQFTDHLGSSYGFYYGSGGGNYYPLYSTGW